MSGSLGGEAAVAENLSPNQGDGLRRPKKERSRRKHEPRREEGLGRRVQEPTDRRVEHFTESVSFDRRLYAHDIAASSPMPKCWPESDCSPSRSASKLSRDWRRSGKKSTRAAFVFRPTEDIHMHVERALIERIGDVGRKLHTARSRNDQVATDMRLWVREAIDQIDAAAGRLFSGRSSAAATRDYDVILPGYTHTATCPAGAGPALLARLLREVPARPAAGWPTAGAGPTC